MLGAVPNISSAGTVRPIFDDVGDGAPGRAGVVQGQRLPVLAKQCLLGSVASAHGATSGGNSSPGSGGL